MKKAYVVIDNKENCVLGIFPKEEYAKNMLKSLGDEKLGEDFARYAYEEWAWGEVLKWVKDPGEMGLGSDGISFLSRTDLQASSMKSMN